MQGGSEKKGASGGALILSRRRSGKGVEVKIAVMGSGGIGGYVGGRLAQAGGDVHFVARGAHLEALRTRGLQIRTPLGDADLTVSATDDPGEIGVADVVLFAVKMRDAAQAAGLIRPMVGPDTRVVTFQNGIDAPGIVARELGAGQVAAGIIYLAANIDRPGVIVSPGGVHRATVDRLDGDPVMAEFLRLSSQLTGLEVQPTDDIQTVLWDKFVALTPLAAATCVTRAPVGVVREHPASAVLFRALVAECIAVAQASGVSLPEDTAQKIEGLFMSQPYGQKSSMLLDLEAGRPLELPWLSGRVVALGEKLGVPTPANAAVVGALAPYAEGPPGTREAG